MSKIKTMKLTDASVVIEWADAQTDEYALDSLDQTIRDRLAVDRLKAKLEDAHASLGSAGIPACREATDSVWDSLVRGEWSRGRSGSPWLLEALVECFPDQMDDEKARKIYDDEKTRRTAYKLPEIKKWKAARDLADADEAPATDVTKLF